MLEFPFAPSASPRQVPHAGYHGTNRSQHFFEGWYFRVTLPQEGQSFAFMYSIEDPGGGSDRSGGTVQVLGPQDELAWRSLPNVNGFWGDRDRLALGHWGQVVAGMVPPHQLLPAGEFFRRVRSGYQVSDRLNQGCFWEPQRGEWVRWLYRVEPLYSYGGLQPEATMGWLSYLSVFEPGWQILMAMGRATGWVEWRGRRHEFERAPAYAEKNWGGAFPLKWFWLHCNAFEDQPQIALTCAGGLRKLLWQTEAVGTASLSWGDRCYRFMPKDSQIRWSVAPWGRWEFEAVRDGDRLLLRGSVDRPATAVMVPTASGMRYACWDTTQGELELQLWRESEDCWELVLEARSRLAGLEVGGDRWDESWTHQT
ncbi:tocopherol cyclase family protein [Synechococcus sp. PCC 7336]|uniref:tocopherol cyclase family protein n=1 Tax=Synechococcus sp. PCC 7336 TaxID=195250 RepID=UPI0003459287|nr:tocopherol cyclase family protein [Synechococcus sp. PCC 7336]